MSARGRDLWSCPRCGARLVARKLSHACGNFSVERFLAGASGTARDLFERFVGLIEQCGPYELSPAKTRIAFMTKVRFASVNRLGATSIDIHFVLPRRIDSPRIRRVEEVGNVWVHHLRLSAPADFDRELLDWLRASYLEYGEREWLRKTHGA